MLYIITTFKEKTMSEWTKISVKTEQIDLAYADIVAKSSSMANGLNEGVTITSVEPIPGYAGLKIVWKDAQGAMKKQTIFATNDDKVTKEKKISLQYIWFGSSLTGDDPKLFQEFFLIEAAANPGILNAVKGLKANVRVGFPRKGYKFKKLGDKGISIMDIETDRECTEFGSSFPTYEAAVEASKEHNIRIRYQEVIGVYPHEGSLDANRQQLRNALETAKAAKGPSIPKPTAVQGF
jgi:hypothetical protein